MMRVALAIQQLLVNVGGLLAYNFIKNEFLQVYILKIYKTGHFRTYIFVEYLSTATLVTLQKMWECQASKTI